MEFVLDLMRSIKKELKVPPPVNKTFFILLLFNSEAITVAICSMAVANKFITSFSLVSKKFKILFSNHSLPIDFAPVCL